jgi:hypothetical protein
MSSEYNTSGQGKSFLPLTLLSVSLISFFSWQLWIISVQSNNLKDSKQKLEDFVSNSVPKLDEQGARAKQVQAGLEKLVLDLLEVAKTDNEAKAIVQKYQIQQQKPANSGSQAPQP